MSVINELNRRTARSNDKPSFDLGISLDAHAAQRRCNIDANDSGYSLGRDSQALPWKSAISQSLVARDVLKILLSEGTGKSPRGRRFEQGEPAARRQHRRHFASAEPFTSAAPPSSPRPCQQPRIRQPAERTRTNSP